MYRKSRSVTGGSRKGIRDDGCGWHEGAIRQKEPIDKAVCVAGGEKDWTPW